MANALASRIETVALLPNHDYMEFQGLLDSEVVVKTFPVPSAGGVMPEQGHQITGTVERLEILKSLIKEIQIIDPDVVHMTFYTSGPLRAYSLSVLVAHLLPTVETVHDPKLHSGQKSFVFGVNIREKVRAQGGLLMNRTIVHGPEMKKQAIEAGYSESKLRIATHGIYTHFPEGDGELNPNQLLFLTIRENKGYDRIPDLIDLVSKRHPEVTAVVAGQVSSSADKD